MQTKKGYKVFRPDWTCAPNGHLKQYSCPGIFVIEGQLSIYKNGMHFCENLIDCFKHYDFDPKNHVAEVTAHGDIQKKGDITCTNRLEIVKELAWEEILRLVNAGEGNTGINNAGNSNTGDYNEGNSNTGDYNEGNSNTGDYNEGDSNTGDYNKGDSNTGDYNEGNGNAGNSNVGNYNTGYYNTGNCNVGGYNAGECNTGNSNIGSWNTGGYNAGECNTGDYNAGNYNVGDYNTGNCNVGDYNAGKYNVGDYNTGNCNVGCFNTTMEPTISLFNQPSDWTYRVWMRSDAHILLNQCPRTTIKWISSRDMTEEEKEEYPDYSTTKGYLKTERNPETVQDWWDALAKEEQNIIRSIPNFDADIFYEVTGIKVE